MLSFERVDEAEHAILRAAGGLVGRAGGVTQGRRIPAVFWSS